MFAADGNAPEIVKLLLENQVPGAMLAPRDGKNDAGIAL